MDEQTRVIEYKCPCCNAGLVFGSHVQQLTCEYCDNTFDIDAVRAYNDAVKMLNNTICNQSETDETTEKLEQALALYGVIDMPQEEKPSRFSILKLFSDVLYALFKGNGYFEKLV